MSGLSSLKVLIVDDHFLTRQVVADVMRQHHVSRVEYAADGREARETIAQAHAQGTPFDVVFLDWNMPVIEGIEVLKHFRAQPAFNATAFIMLTAQSAQAEVLDAIKSGATGYIVKPVAKEVISKKLTEVAEWIRKKKAESAAKKP